MDHQTILVINAGSSSVKFAAYDQHQETPLVAGQVAPLGAANCQLTFALPHGQSARTLAQATHSMALHAIFQALSEPGTAHHVMPCVTAVGHRVVHGGPQSDRPALITNEIKKAIYQFSEFAPLHNPLNLAGIEAVEHTAPHLPQYAVFDTAFHNTLPAVAKYYAIPKEWAQAWHVHRFGFHGINHQYIAQRSQALLPSSASSRNIVSAHLGNGCSLCAIQSGISIDTSMGFTPLEGLVMGTRSGDLDPGIAEFLCQKFDLTIQQLTEHLNRNSGLKGLSGVSSDMRSLQQAADQGHADARFAIELFCYRLAKYIASYAVPLGGIDALVFTGGIGEHAPAIRQRVVEWLTPLGFALDSTLNTRNDTAIISAGHSTPILVIPANEEWMIAQQGFALFESTSQEPTQ